MKPKALAVVSILVLLMGSAPDAAADCKYYDCYSSEHQTYAECRQIICPSWNINCNGSNWATSCTVTCDFGCWCNYVYCMDI